jgi:hypothetical protein
MTDHDFALAILDLMPQDEGWHAFLSGLRTKVRESDTHGLPLNSSTFTTAIRDEYWYRHKDDYQTTSHIFSARFEAQKRANVQKRPRPTPDSSISGAVSTPPAKRARPLNPERATKLCTNTNCDFPRGHDTSDCISFKGAKEGQYNDRWRGPWNIHLPHSQRTKDNNVPPKSHPAHTRLYTPTVNQALFTPPDGPIARSSTTHIHSDDDSAHANAAVSFDPTCHVWASFLDDVAIQTTLPVLNRAVPIDNACYHDSGANRHVFHDRHVFEQYESITPLTVKGFGRNLSALAVGRGTVRLEGHYLEQTSPILLTNVLHIPAARSNLISGVQLDKAGVTSTLGNNSIVLSIHGNIIVNGTLYNDMYRLNLHIVSPHSTSLASRIMPATPSSLLSPQLTSSHAPNLSFYIA